MSYIYQPFDNGVWYIQVCINGVKSRKSLKTTDKATAKRLQLLYDSKAAGIKTGLMSRRQNIDAVIQEYLEMKRPSIRPRSFERYVELAEKLTHHFQENKVAYVDQIDSGIVAKYFTARQEAGVAPKTVDDELFLLRSLLKWLLSENRISENPVRQWPKIRIVPKAPETLGAYSLEEIQKMKEFFRFREFHDCFLFALYTGCRREEMNLATVADFDQKRGRIRLRNKKTETNPKDVWRYVSVHPELIKILTERCSDRRGTEKLFPELMRHSRNWPAVEIKAACKSEGIQYKRFHGLRHTFITHLLAGGVDIRQVQGAAGHTSLETTQGYLHLVEEVADVTRLKY